MRALTYRGRHRRWSELGRYLRDLGRSATFGALLVGALASATGLLP